jgi:hypothetical protein
MAINVEPRASIATRRTTAIGADLPLLEDEIRAAGRVTLAYQHNSGNAYVTIAGRAEIIDEPSAVESRLQQVDDPGGTLQGKLVAVKCSADHLELHARGVTDEPWGHGRTLLQRDRKGAWNAGYRWLLPAALQFSGRHTRRTPVVTSRWLPNISAE